MSLHRDRPGALVKALVPSPADAQAAEGLSLFGRNAAIMRSYRVTLRDFARSECFTDFGALNWASTWSAAEAYTTLTDNLFSIDQAVARTEMLERQLSQARQQHRRDVVALRSELAALRSEFQAARLGTKQREERTAIRTDFRQVATLLDSALRQRLEKPAEISSREVFDSDLGGAVLEITISVPASPETFKELRREVLSAYEEIAGQINTSDVVLLIRRAA